MSTYAFDLDGTLDRPELAQLARDLFAAGHEVHIVTGARADVGEWTIAARQEKLASLAVNYTLIHRCFGATHDAVGSEKRRVCDEIGALLMFDDAPSYIKELSYGRSCILQVIPKRGPLTLAPKEWKP